MEYSSLKEYCGFSESGLSFYFRGWLSVGLLSHCDKSLEHCLPGKISETLKTAMLCTCGGGEREREEERLRITLEIVTE